MDQFRGDARNVKLRIGDHFIEDVTDVLKRFFREVDDPIFMADLHPLWQEAASESQSSLVGEGVLPGALMLMGAIHIRAYADDFFYVWVCVCVQKSVRGV